MSKLSRRAVLSTGGRAAVATLALGSVSVAATDQDADARRGQTRGSKGVPRVDEPPTLAELDAAILAAIERCRVAQARHAASCVGEPEYRTLEYEEWDRRVEEACGAAADATWALLETEPVTIGGVAAVFAYVSSDPELLEYARRDEDFSFSRDLVKWAAESLAGGQANA